MKMTCGHCGGTSEQDDFRRASEVVVKPNGEVRCPKCGKWQPVAVRA